MNKEQKQVREFMLGCCQAVPDKPIIPDMQTRILRVRLMLEEVLEYCEAAGLRVWFNEGYENLENPAYEIDVDTRKDVDPVEMADALVDTLYVTYGAGLAQGLDLEPLFNAVHENNLTKFDGGYTDENGKFRKGPNYRPIDLTDLVEKQKQDKPTEAFKGGPAHTSLG